MFSIQLVFKVHVASLNQFLEVYFECRAMKIPLLMFENYQNLYAEEIQNLSYENAWYLNTFYVIKHFFRLIKKKR